MVLKSSLQHYFNSEILKYLTKITILCELEIVLPKKIFRTIFYRATI